MNSVSVEPISLEQTLLRSAIGGMADALVAVDDRRQIVVQNDAARQMLGLARDSDLSRTPIWQDVINEPILRAINEVLDGGDRRSIQVGLLFGRHLEISVSPLNLPGGARGAVLVGRDTTQSTRYEELRKEFVANVSHELRTPLTAIKGFTETLQAWALTDPVKGPEYLATIEKHADQLNNLVGDLLELSRLESSSDTMRRTIIDVPPIVRHAVEMLASLAERKQQRLEVDIAADLPRIVGIADYLERAVSNLIENAIKYTPADGRVLVRVGEKGDRVEIEVVDTGIGIPEADVPRIFERFYRVDRSRSRDMGGTGLGLSIVKHVAQLHGGTIEVTSTPGKGSTFSLSLPVNGRGGAGVIDEATP